MKYKSIPQDVSDHYWEFKIKFPSPFFTLNKGVITMTLVGKFNNQF
ncbi:hypothetical protein ACFSKN_01930 [Mariniflexile gromovii]|nr:hypothetical protein [Mariniflexile gromovii]